MTLSNKKSAKRSRARTHKSLSEQSSSQTEFCFSCCLKFASANFFIMKKLSDCVGKLPVFPAEFPCRFKISRSPMAEPCLTSHLELYKILVGVCSNVNLLNFILLITYFTCYFY